VKNVRRYAAAQQFLLGFSLYNGATNFTTHRSALDVRTMETALFFILVLIAVVARLWAGYAFAKHYEAQPQAEREALRRALARDGH
jgi:hypothetical protein